MVQAAFRDTATIRRSLWAGKTLPLIPNSGLYNLVPYQRRAQHAGQCGVEVEGGTVPTRDWFLNLQILTSGGFR
jgi:hypothetical protein